MNNSSNRSHITSSMTYGPINGYKKTTTRWCCCKQLELWLILNHLRGSMIRRVMGRSGHWKLPITTLFVSATLNVWRIIMVNKRLLSDVFRRLSCRWIKAITLLQYFCTLLCVNSRFCTNVSSTKDCNQLNIYGNCIASCNTKRFPHDILNLLYFQTFDEAPDLFLQNVINTDMKETGKRSWRHFVLFVVLWLFCYMSWSLICAFFGFFFSVFLVLFVVHFAAVFQPLTHTCFASVHQLTCFHSVINLLFSSRDHSVPAVPACFAHVFWIHVATTFMNYTKILY